MTDETEQHDEQRAFRLHIDVALLAVVIGRGGLADAIKHLAPNALAELRQAINTVAGGAKYAGC